MTFRSRRGARLVGLWHGGTSDAAIVLCHGMEATKEGIKSVRLATALADHGIHALRFDFSYVGESEGEFLDLTVSGEVEDLAGAWAFARARVPGPLGIIGSSLGGTVALLFAAAEPSVAALTTIAAVADPGRRARALAAEERARWRAEGAYTLHGVRLGAAFLDDVEGLAVLDRLSTVRCPVLLTTALPTAWCHARMPTQSPRASPAPAPCAATTEPITDSPILRSSMRCSAT